MIRGPAPSNWASATHFWRMLEVRCKWKTEYWIVLSWASWKRTKKWGYLQRNLTQVVCRKWFVPRNASCNCFIVFDQLHCRDDLGACMANDRLNRDAKVIQFQENILGFAPGESKCTATTQPLICENLTGPGGTCILEKDASQKQSPHFMKLKSLLWLDFILTYLASAPCCPELHSHFWKCYVCLPHSPAASAAVISAVPFSTEKNVFLLPSFPIKWQSGRTHFANKILKHFTNGG